MTLRQVANTPIVHRKIICNAKRVITTIRIPLGRKGNRTRCRVQTRCCGRTRSTNPTSANSRSILLGIWIGLAIRPVTDASRPRNTHPLAPNPHPEVVKSRLTVGAPRITLYCNTRLAVRHTPTPAKQVIGRRGVASPAQCCSRVHDETIPRDTVEADPSAAAQDVCVTVGVCQQLGKSIAV